MGSILKDISLNFSNQKIKTFYNFYKCITKEKMYLNIYLKKVLEDFEKRSE